MFTIYENGAWRRASPARAAEVASTANGAKVSPGALKSLPDATLVTWGVRRLDNAPRPVLLPYQDIADGPINPTGDRAVQTWVAIDKPLDNAKQEALDNLVTIAERKRSEDVTYNQGGVDYEFPMVADKVHHYTTLGSALGSGAGFPGGGVAFVVKQGGNRARLRVNQGQWQAVVQAMAGALISVNENEEALENSIDAAVDLTALRAIDLEAGW